MPKPIRPLLSSGTAALVLIGLHLSSAALAHQVSFATEVTIDGQVNSPRNHWVGSVDSSKPRCVENRLVKLRLEPLGGGPPQFMGKDRADAAGNWAIFPDSLNAGDYIARAPRFEFERRSHSHICESDESPPHFIDE